MNVLGSAACGINDRVNAGGMADTSRVCGAQSTHFVVMVFSTGNVMKDRVAGCFFTRIIHSSLLMRPSFAMSASSNVFQRQDYRKRRQPIE